MTITRANALFAVRNIARHGDTDVYPYPIENHWFHDSEDAVVELLLELDGDFDQWLRHYPVSYTTGLSRVGYNGFRSAIQIDAIWNAYLLALLLEIGSEIEKARIPADKSTVFSYRFEPSPEKATIFNKEIGWYQFQKEALERATRSEFIVSTDISDFYSRVYHHRLDNALKQATKNADAVGRIMQISKKLSIGETS